MFQGFSNQTIDFLWNVRFNNNREWMAEHRQDYQQHLLLPMRELAGEVLEKMSKAFPDEHLACHVSRIYRDARRCHGKPPLKEDLWFSLFSGAERDTSTPEFFFSVEPEGYSYGLGVWSAKPADMARFRRDVLERPERIAKLVGRFQQQSVFELAGQDYVRVEGEVPEAVRPWFVKKKLYFHCERNYDALCFSPELVTAVVEGFSFLIPYYRYFTWICRQGEPNEKL